jgi:COP9 signalosome complex subunit 3
LLPIKKAIIKLQNSNKMLLTPVHSDLLQLSLASMNYTLALDLLSNEITEMTKNFDSKYLLCFYYYASCIYGSLRDYESGLFYLEQALTLPASAISKIMIESYKKFILFSLISRGRLTNLPKYTSRVVINQIKPICSIYHEIGGAFVNGDFDKLIALCSKYQTAIDADQNGGIIKLLHKAFFKNNIQKLTKTFVTLSLTDMGAKVKLGSGVEAEKYMFNMIINGEIFASINQKDGN